jgi:cytochrome c551/c552
VGGLEEMTLRCPALLLLSTTLLGLPAMAQTASKDKNLNMEFRTSDRCVACHNELKTSSGEDISIGFQWRASMMANSARDPYWQGSVRRESMDHPESQANIEDECSVCHMPITHLTAKSEGQKTRIFAHLPISSSDQEHRAAADGVSCSVCHQIEKARLGTNEAVNGNVVIASAQNKDQRPEYGPFVIDAGHRRVMQSSTGGFVPEAGDQIRDSALCGSCHTLKTKALGPEGKEIGSLPEQMPYQEWLHSDYPGKQTCQSCHMPEVQEAVPITVLYGKPRVGMHRHEFIGGNFFLQRILNGHRDELGVAALPPELSTAADRTANFLQAQSARVSIRNLQSTATGLSIDVLVENLTGHKLPTAYPSRRAWLRMVVRDSSGRVVFQSGALNPDGSIVGNDNDADPLRFEPYYHEITSPEQVQIFEPILKDAQGKVTTGLLSAIGYLKDSRILPSGFDKKTAEPDISVVGEAADDRDFNDKGALTRYVIKTGNAVGPFHVEAELWYQPIGFRWAHNLAPYQAMEPQRFIGYYEAAAEHSAIVLARAEANR